MGVAGDLAIVIRQRLGISGRATEDDLDDALADFGLQVDLGEVANGLGYEVVAGNRVIIQRGLPTRRRRWLKAHVLGHLYLHVGDQRVLDDVVCDKQEAAADEFAAWFVLGGEVPEWRGQGHAELLEWAELPEEALPVLLEYLK